MGVKNTKQHLAGDSNPSTPNQQGSYSSSSSPDELEQSGLPRISSSKPNMLSKKSSNTMIPLVKEPGIYAFGKIAPIKAESKLLIPILSLNKLPIASMNSTQLATFVMTDEGRLYSFGLQLHGELGIGCSEKPISEPTVVAKFEEKKIIALACGYRHVLALTDTHKLFAWGSHEHRALGVSDTADNTFPSKVTELKHKNVKLIAAGYEHSIACTEDGTVYAWGSNDKGQVGVGTSSGTLETPTVLAKLSSANIQAVYAHAYMNIAVTDTWHYYVWGENKSGNLGLGNKDDENEPMELPTLAGTKIKSFAMGRTHVLALTHEGEVYAWGSNSHGQLGVEGSVEYLIPTKLPFKQILEIGASEYGSAMLSDSYELFMFGKELLGETKRVVPEIHPQLVGAKVRGMHLSCNRLFVFVA